MTHSNQASRRRFLGSVTTASILAGLPRGLFAAQDSDPAPAPTRSVRRVRIPRTGELVPCIGLGTSRTFDVDPNDLPTALIDVMQRFVNWGGSVIDSSPMYKRSEAVVGALLDTLQRRDMFYATKVWTKEGKQAGIEQMATSETLMGTPRFDLMQVHNLVGLKEHMETLREWKASGRVRYIGITEMGDMETVEELVAGGVIDFIQIPYSVTDRSVEARVLPACIEHQVAVLVMRPFQAGRLFDAVKGQAVPEWAADFEASTWGQLFLKFILGHASMPIPIPATSKPHHMDDNMAAGMGPALDAAARQKLIAILEG
jgi:diketogulonate reductase-like aldo/keto reductase